MRMSMKTMTDTNLRPGRPVENEARPGAESAQRRDPEFIQALERMERAKTRFFGAAVAFCDGAISAGQLRAAREFLREQEQRVQRMEGQQAAPFVEPPVVEEKTEPEIVESSPSTPSVLDESVDVDLQIPDAAPPELKRSLTILDQKIRRLQQDFQQGRVNASQYQAIRKHYLEQREVAIRLKQKNPESDRWRIVLEEGKTTFLMQLNEAACLSVGFYDIETRDRIFVQGIMPQAAEDAMALLGTFGAGEPGSQIGRMYATQTDDGKALLLIPGYHTVGLAVFSQSPPAWQVRALREVHRNFEAANRSALDKHRMSHLVFPDLQRFVKGT